MMNSATAENAATDTGQRDRFVPVAIDTLAPSAELPFDLFLQPDANQPPVLYRERRLAVDEDDLARLLERAIQTLYIRVSEHVAYRNYLRHTVLSDADLPPSRRFKILQIANRTILQLAFQNPRPDMLVDIAAEYGRELATVVCNDSLVLTDLLPLMIHDYQTYTHATNVCTLSLMIAVVMGMGFADGIVEMATAMLLHDLGKRRIPPAILNQRAPLTPQQRDTFRQHPKWGFQELCRRQDVTLEQLLVVYQHHEHWNGRGYPVGLVGEEVHLWARICSVADAYDTLTSSRSGRGEQDVWATLDEGRNSRFDAEIVKCLKSAVGPVETRVDRSTPPRASSHAASGFGNSS